MKKEKIVSILAIVLCIIAVIVSIVRISNEHTVELTQLSDHSKRQMMGYILKTKNNKIIVIDGGTTDDTENLIKQINKHGGKVDAWFLTHLHDDHLGAFSNIANDKQIQIGKIYCSFNEYSWYEENEPSRAEFSKQILEILKQDDIKDKVEEVSLNQDINIDDVKIEILGIKNPEITENAGNEQSMVVKFDTGKTTFLVLGDTGIKSSEKLLNTQKEKLKSDIVQMAHHGQNGATKELYEQINPTICMWPTPEWLWNNDSGEGKGSGPWKTLETRLWMEELKVKKNYVEKDGDITIKLK
mgnify:FL=1